MNIIRQIGANPMWVQGNETLEFLKNDEMFFIGQLDANLLINEAAWIFLF